MNALYRMTYHVRPVKRAIFLSLETRVAHNYRIWHHAILSIRENTFRHRPHIYHDVTNNLIFTCSIPDGEQFEADMPNSTHL